MTTRKAIAAAVLVSVTAIPLAAAHGGMPHGHEACKPNVSVMLKGTLASNPAAGATSLMLSVTGSNAHGKSLKGLGVTIALDAKTKVRRQGAKTVESLAMNDRASVQIRRCKADLPLSAATVDDVAAARITAQAAKP